MVDQVKENLTALENLVDELVAHLNIENSLLPTAKPDEIKSLVQKKEVLSTRYNMLVARLFTPPVPYNYRENASNQLRKKVIELDALLKENTRITAAVKGARESFIEVVKKVVTRHQRPHTNIYNQRGSKAPPPKRRLNISLSMNYCY